MSLAGAFLVSFLLVHMGINLLVILYKDPMVFNKAAHFMGTNKIIKVFEIVLFGGFLLHILYGILLQIQNWMARPNRYYTYNKSEVSAFSKYMIHTALIILVFLVIHIADFYYKAKFAGDVGEMVVDGVHYHDLASLVIEKFRIPGFVILYIASFVFLGFHLVHGVQSAFKTLGYNNPRTLNLIRIIAITYAVIVVSGFTSIPLVIYFQ